MGEVFIGSEAVAEGRLTRHELQRWYRPSIAGYMCPNGWSRRCETERLVPGWRRIGEA